MPLQCRKNPDTTFGFHNTNAIIAKARAIQKAKDLANKLKEQKSKMTALKKAEGERKQLTSYDEIKKTITKFAENGEVNAESIKSALRKCKGNDLKLAYQYIGGKASKLQDVKKETIVDAMSQHPTIVGFSLDPSSNTDSKSANDPLDVDTDVNNENELPDVSVKERHAKNEVE